MAVEGKGNRGNGKAQRQPRKQEVERELAIQVVGKDIKRGRTKRKRLVVVGFATVVVGFLNRMPLLTVGLAFELGVVSLRLLFYSWLNPPQLCQPGPRGRRFVHLVAGYEKDLCMPLC